MSEAVPAKIPRARPSLLRRAVLYVLTILVSMALGKGAEMLLEPHVFAAFEEAQDAALHAVQGFDPLTAVRRFACAAELGASFPDLVEADCARVVMPVPLSTILQPRFGIDLPRAAPPPVPAEPTVGHWARDWPIQLRPLIALLDVLWHLVAHSSGWASIFALMQFALGLGLVLVLDPERGETGSWAKYAIFYPLGVVAFGFLFGFITKLLMIGGLTLFGRFVTLAGLCCGAGGMVRFAYEFAVKMLEDRVHHAVVSRINPH